MNFKNIKWPVYTEESMNGDYSIFAELTITKCLVIQDYRLKQQAKKNRLRVPRLDFCEFFLIKDQKD